jgi:hypothetical protein
VNLYSVLPHGSKTDDEWESYIREANVENTFIERGKRWLEFFNECKSNPTRGGSHFSDFAQERFGISQSAASQWVRIGMHADELITIGNKFNPDWRALYEFTRLPQNLKQLLLEQDQPISRKSIKSISKSDQHKATRNLKYPTGVRLGDFREVLSDLPDESISLILTDPPYSQDSVALYRDLAIFAERKLVYGGSILAYSGQHNLPEVLRVFGETSLRYWWTLAVTHSAGNQRMPGKFVMIGWKPVIWYVKGERIKQEYVRDVIKGDRPDKGIDSHEWAQGANEAAYLIEQLTDQSDLICDPFAGSGIFGEMANRLNRNFVGAEIGEQSNEND